MYKLASALSCTAQEDCSGGPNFRDQSAVNADGWATQEPWPFVRCIRMPRARSSPVMHTDLHRSVGDSIHGQSTGNFHSEHERPVVGCGGAGAAAAGAVVRQEDGGLGEVCAVEPPVAGLVQVVERLEAVGDVRLLDAAWGVRGTGGAARRGAAGGGGLLLRGWGVQRPPPPLCDIPLGCCFFTGPWTVTRSPLRMLRRVAAAGAPAGVVSAFACHPAPLAE